MHPEKKYRLIIYRTSLKYNLVKSLLKLIILFILVAVAYSSGASVSDSASRQTSVNGIASQTVISAFDLLENAHDIYTPCRTIPANIFRPHGSGKRANSLQKSSSEFIRTTKVVNTDVGNFIQKNSLIVHSQFIRPAHRVISLGKLII